MTVAMKLPSRLGSGASAKQRDDDQDRERNPEEPGEDVTERASLLCGTGLIAGAAFELCHGGYFFLRLLLRAGTFAPARRASERPMAIACLRLFTLRPERPLRSVPALRSCIARLTLLWAFFPYRAMRIAPAPSAP